MTRQVNQRQLISYSKVLTRLKTYKLHGDPNRTYLVVSFDPTGASSGFDVALVRRGDTPLTENWMDGLGINNTRYDIDNGCGGDVYFRDTDNPNDETLIFVSDTPIVLEEVTL